MAAGRVCTGYSLPYVALYSHTGTTVNYTQGQKLARGVSVSADITTADENIFYADNIDAEEAPGKFTSGSLTCTVDGLRRAAAKLIMGLPEAAADGFVHYGDDQNIPFCGYGFIARYQSDGIVYYVPYIFPKVKFSIPGIDAATQEENIDWQTQDLEAAIKRSDGANHDWRLDGDEYSTEAEAEAAIRTFFSITE